MTSTRCSSLSTGLTKSSHPGVGFPVNRVLIPLESEYTSLQQPKLGPDPTVCACGRRRDAASSYIHQSNVATYVYHRCECGVEWTESRPSVDRSEPVSTDEVLEVHASLLEFEGTLRDLIAKPAEEAEAEN